MLEMIAKPGDIIYNQGEVVDKLMFLNRGLIQLYKLDHQKNKVSIAQIKVSAFPKEWAVARTLGWARARAQPARPDSLTSGRSLLWPSLHPVADPPYKNACNNIFYAPWLRPNAGKQLLWAGLVFDQKHLRRNWGGSEDMSDHLHQLRPVFSHRQEIQQRLRKWRFHQSHNLCT